VWIFATASGGGAGMLGNILCTLVYLLIKFTACASHVLNYDSVTICDGMEKVVRCPNKENIHVLQGFYGKWKNHDCNGIKMDPPGTHTCSKDRQETTKAVRNICQGKNQCTFVADKKIYGDPCPDSNAYLYITFFCMAPGKHIEHQKDKNNHEVVTVLTHGFLVSERKYAQPVESQTDKTTTERTVSELATTHVGNTSPAEEKPTNEKSELDRKITIPTASPASDVEEGGEAKSVVASVPESSSESSVDRNNIPSEGTTENQTTLDPNERNANVAVLNYDSVTICDGMEKVVRCPNRENIHILQGFYGKWKNHDCHGVRIDPTNANTCSQPRQMTTAAVRKSCLGQNQCTFVADRNLFGDPCPASEPYLYVTFFCLQRGKQIEHERDKDNKEIVTVLSHGYLVSEKKHTPENRYGTATAEIMSPTSRTAETSSNHREGLQSKLVIPKVHSGAVAEGDSQHAVIVTPVRDERNNILSAEKIADEDGAKRGEIMGQKNLTVMVCNGERHAISCKRDVGMLILSAFYGKSNGKDCRGDLGYRDDIPDCVNPRALDSVKFLCENRKSCELASEKELFGDDTCPGVNKYLEVTYQC